MNKILIIPYKKRGKREPLFAVNNVYDGTVKIKRVAGYTLLEQYKLSDAHRLLKMLKFDVSGAIHTESLYDLTSKSKVTLLLVRCKYKQYSTDNISWVTMHDLLKKSNASKSTLSKIHKFAKSPVCLDKG